jgi:hypothetical protein
MDAPNKEFALAGSLEELKAKGRLVVHGSHRLILVIYDRVGVVLQRCGTLGAHEYGVLVELVDELATKIATDDRNDWLNARLDEARRCKVIDAIDNTDMQDPAITLIPAAQNPADDKDGMRDFSRETVRQWHLSHDILRPAFENRWCTHDAQPREAATAPGS